MTRNEMIEYCKERYRQADIRGDMYKRRFYAVLLGRLAYATATDDVDECRRRKDVGLYN